MTEEKPVSSFLDALFSVVDSQGDPELASIIFTDSRDELTAAHAEGWKACKGKIPITANPYETVEGQVYSKNLAWSEGWMGAFMESDMTL